MSVLDRKAEKCTLLKFYLTKDNNLIWFKNKKVYAISFKDIVKIDCVSKEKKLLKKMNLADLS